MAARTAKGAIHEGGRSPTGLGRDSRSGCHFRICGTAAAFSLLTFFFAAEKESKTRSVSITYPKTPSDARKAFPPRTLSADRSNNPTSTGLKFNRLKMPSLRDSRLAFGVES